MHRSVTFSRDDTNWPRQTSVGEADIATFSLGASSQAAHPSDVHGGYFLVTSHPFDSLSPSRTWCS